MKAVGIAGVNSCQVFLTHSAPTDVGGATGSQHPSQVRVITNPGDCTPWEPAPEPGPSFLEPRRPHSHSLSRFWGPLCVAAGDPASKSGSGRPSDAPFVVPGQGTSM